MTKAGKKSPLKRILMSITANLTTNTPMTPAKPLGVRIANEILMYFRGRKKYAQDLYIQDPIDVDTDGNALTLMDIMAQDTDILEDVDRKLKSDRLHHYISQELDPREQQVIRLRYGLDGKTPMAQREVAAILGISRSYVSRIEKKAVGILRKCFAKDLPHGL